MSELSFFVGIDLGNEKHALCVLDQSGKKRVHKVLTPEQVLPALKAATKGATPAQVAVGLEDPNDATADVLLSAGFMVFSINPKQVDAFRSRHTAAGVKDDLRDALVLAMSLRTDHHVFHRVVQRTRDERELRILRQTLTAFDHHHRVLANQLRAALRPLVPQLLELCPGADEPWFWNLVDLLQRSASDDVTLQDVRAALGRKRKPSPEQVWDVLREAWHGLNEDNRHLLAGFSLASQIDVLRTVESKRGVLHKAMEAAVAKAMVSADGQGPTDMAIVTSMTGIGTKTAAAVVGEIGRTIAAGQWGRVRALCGTAPVTMASGKKHQVRMRYACNNTLRNALHHAAHSAVMNDDDFRAYYERVVARGHNRARALRSVADRMLRILMVMLRDRTLYCPKTAGKPAS